MIVPHPTRQFSTRAGRLAALGLSVLLAAMLATPGAAVSIGLVDDFQGGTAGWGTGGPHPTPPSIAFDAGAGGVGDHALQLTSSGNPGPGGKLSMFNTAQWSGDYTGITGIALSVNNVGASNLELRLLIRGATGDFSSGALSVTAGSGWQDVLIPILPGDLVSVGGVDPAAALAAVSLLRLWHAPLAVNTSPPAIAASLLLDNVTAVPEPGSALLLLAGLGGLGAAGRRRRTP